jgi:large subunit ribosomal protein L35Ae
MCIKRTASFKKPVFFLGAMQGIIINFRGGKHTQKNNQMVIQPDGVDNLSKAKALAGKTVVWSAPGKDKKQIKGKVTLSHGRNGAVRVIFERGMPGQAVGQKVEFK